MPHDLLDLAMFLVPLVLLATLLAVALCVAAGRGDRQLKEAWDRERERNEAAIALNKGWQDGAS